MTALRRERLQVAATAVGMRLDRYLAQALAPASRKAIKRALDQGQVFIDGRCEGRAGRILNGGEAVDVTLDAEVPVPELPVLIILWREDGLLAIDKPAALPAHPTVAGRINALDLVSELIEREGGERPILLHRLDADTTGILLFALDRAANLDLSRQFSEHRIVKTYLALVSGTPPQRFRIDNHLQAGIRGRTLAVRSGGQPAQTDFRTLWSGEGIALVEASPQTGRTHQIRTHLAGAGFPLLGDRLYGGAETVVIQGQVLVIRRHLLHARRLAFSAPQRGTPCVIEAPLPDDFLAILPSDGLVESMQKW